MIMPRKARRMIIIVATIVVISIIAMAFLLLYINTDMFKSSSTLFTEYIGQNLENGKAVYDKMRASEYDTLLEQNKYITETQMKVNYTTNVGTSSENSQNSISQLNLKINGQTDSSKQYKYQDISLLSNDEKIAQIEYIQNGLTHGIKFSDLFNQYLLVNNENLKEFFQKIGYTEQQLENIPDTIELNQDLNNIFRFSKEEEQNLKTKYLSIIKSNTSKDNFSKQRDQTIQIAQNSIKANAYVLTMNKEQLNNISIKLLEEIKQDETILTKVDELQTMIQPFQLEDAIDVREQFVKKVENLINNITKNNIGKEETKIIVYESNKTTVRTILEHPDYVIKMDFFSSQTEDYAQLSYQDVSSEGEKIFTYRKGKEETSVVFTNRKNGKTTQYTYLVNEEIKENHCQKTIVANYEDEFNKVEATIGQDTNIVNSLENEVVLKEGDAINLSELEAEQVQAILERVNTSISQKADEIMTNTIKPEDIRRLGETLGMVEQDSSFEARGVTETEKNRFNSKFEILQGEELDSTAILNLINAIQENLVDLEVISNTELRLKLDRFHKKEEVATTLSSFIENNKNRKYNVKVEYEEGTGLVKDMVLTMLEK